MDSFYNFVTSCGLRAINITENQMEIDISATPKDGPDTSTLQLTVHFGEGDGSDIVEDVTVGY